MSIKSAQLQIQPEGGTRLYSQRVIPTRNLSSLAEDARGGLLHRPRSLPPKYFYDERGALLFERICATPEYYPTRTEAALLKDNAAKIIEHSRPEHILELGSGSSTKTRFLLDACTELDIGSLYWPFDVSQEMLIRSGEALIQDYPWLRVNALVGDYHGGLSRLPLPQNQRQLIVFLGGTIGNFSKAASVAFLQEVATLMGPDDLLLLGVDRVKHPAILNAAYNDAGGITAAFNLNLLQALNRRLDGNFDPDGFYHSAYFHADRARIEMHLVSARTQRVRLGQLDADLEFVTGETILTEISRKFTAASLQGMVEAAGLSIREHYEAPNAWYSLVLAECSP